MAEAKPLASLTSGLLARKGGAKPAMRRQVALDTGMSTNHLASTQAQDDLGWNDMGYDVNPDQNLDHSAEDGKTLDNRAMLSPMTSVTPAVVVSITPAAEPAVSAETPNVVRQQEALETALENAMIPAAKPVLDHRHAVSSVRKPRRQAGSKGTFAFTLRLDPDRHMKLRLASALKNISAQNMLTDAVDQLLGAIPGLDAVAAQARDAMPKGAKT